MPTIAHCQKRARELTALAELDEPEHKAQHLADAAAWTRLAKRMLEMALCAAWRSRRPRASQARAAGDVGAGYSLRSS